MSGPRAGRMLVALASAAALVVGIAWWVAPEPLTASPNGGPRAAPAPVVLAPVRAPPVVVAEPPPPVPIEALAQAIDAVAAAHEGFTIRCEVPALERRQVSFSLVGFEGDELVAVVPTPAGRAPLMDGLAPAGNKTVGWIVWEEAESGVHNRCRFEPAASVAVRVEVRGPDGEPLRAGEARIVACRGAVTFPVGGEVDALALPEGELCDVRVQVPDGARRWRTVPTDCGEMCMLRPFADQDLTLQIIDPEALDAAELQAIRDASFARARQVMRVDSHMPLDLDRVLEEASLQDDARAFLERRRR